MSYQVIARKYRPQIFDEVAGQPLITETLKNAVTGGRVAHGYIFSGARGVGKTSTARILAKSLNCVKGPTVKPCGVCPSCVEIAAGNSPDVFEIDAASNRGIDEIRQLRETSRYLPARDPYRVFIIDEAHMLTTEAFNALLKTLEEPPARSLFILATTEPHKLPPTIQSRCQHFAFRLLDDDEIAARLRWVTEQEKAESDDDALSTLARAAEGSLRDALSLLDQVMAAGDARLEGPRVRQLLGVVPAETLSGLAEAIAAADAPRVLEGVARLVGEGYELAHFCGQFTRFIRDLTVAKISGEASPLVQAPSGERAALARLAKEFSAADLARFFQILLRAEADMRYSLHPRFDLELALLKLVYAKRLAPLETLLAELQSASGEAHPSNAASRPEGGLRAEPQSFPRETKASALAPPFDSSRSSPAESRSSAARPATTVNLPRIEAPAQAAPAPPPVRPRSVPEGQGGVLRPAQEDDPRLQAIKTLAFERSKMVGACLDSISGWRFEDGEVQLLFPKETIGAGKFLDSREQQDLLRAVCAQVLAQPVRKICVKLDDVREGNSRLSARERADRDEAVQVFQRLFSGVVVEVIDLRSR